MSDVMVCCQQDKRQHLEDKKDDCWSTVTQPASWEREIKEKR